MKVEFENKMKNEFIVRLSHKEEVIRNDIESGIDNVVKERTRESVTLHSQNAELKLKLQDLTEKVVQKNIFLYPLKYNNLFNRVYQMIRYQNFNLDTMKFKVIMSNFTMKPNI